MVRNKSFLTLKNEKITYPRVHSHQNWFGPDSFRKSYGMHSIFFSAVPKYQEKIGLVERYCGTIMKSANIMLFHIRFNKKIFYHTKKYAHSIHDIIPVKDCYEIKGNYFGLPNDSACWLLYMPDGKRILVSIDALFDDDFTPPLYTPDLSFSVALKLRDHISARVNNGTIVESTYGPSGQSEVYQMRMIQLLHKM